MNITDVTNQRLWIRMAQYLSYVLPDFMPSRATKRELVGLWMKHGQAALDAVPASRRDDPAYIELKHCRK